VVFVVVDTNDDELLADILKVVAESVTAVETGLIIFGHGF
jgi:hypothetical protein